MEVDQVVKSKKGLPSKSGTFKKIDIPGMSAADLLVGNEDEDFKLNPV
jgi:hypothetical protein